MSPSDLIAKGDGTTDDTAALVAMGKAGGAINLRTGGTYILAGKSFRLASGSRLTARGVTFLYREGWASGGAITGTDWTNPVEDVVIDMTGSKIVYDGIANTMPRKGIIICGKGWKVIGARVEAGLSRTDKGNIDQFGFEFRDATGCTMTGCTFDMVTGQQGCDGIHFTGNSQDNHVNGCSGRSGDDTISFTHETWKDRVCEIARNNVNGGTFETLAHSNIKALTSVGNGSSIHDCVVSGAKMITRKVGANPGIPFYIGAKLGDRIANVTAPGCEWLAA